MPSPRQASFQTGDHSLLNGGRAKLVLGPWHIDPELGRIVQAGTSPRQLEPKVMELLLALAEEPGRLVTHETLQERLWNGAYIAPGALKHLIWQLRKDLGDNAQSPRFVETVARRGYRLVQPTTAFTDFQSGGEQSRRDPKAAMLALAAMVLLGLGAAMVGWYLSATGVTPVPTRRGIQDSAPRATPLTALEGNEIGPALAPDGSSVVFAWDGGSDGDDFDLYQQAIVGDRSPVRLGGSPADDFEPTFSPSGEQVAFLRGDARRGGKELLVLDLSNGEERLLASAGRGRFLEVVWNHRGSAVIASLRPAPGKPAHLIAFALENGATRVLTTPPADTRGDHYPTLSPDGSLLAFYRMHEGYSGRIVLQDTPTETERQLEVEVGSVAGIAFDAAGTGLIVSSDRVPPRGLWWVPLDAIDLLDQNDQNDQIQPRWLGLPGNFVTDPTQARGSLVYQNQQCDSNVWALNVDSNQVTRLDHLVSTRQDMQARISPDGQRVAYLSSRSGDYQIWLADLPDGSPILLPTEAKTVLSLAWSPRGDRLAFAARSTRVSSVHLVSVSSAIGESREVRLSSPTENALNPSWSRDGRSIYYSVRKNKGWQVRRHHLATGDRAEVGSGIVAREDPEIPGLWTVRHDRPGLWFTPFGEVEGVGESGSGGDGGDVKAELVVPELWSIDAQNWDFVPGGIVFPSSRPDGERHLMRWNRAAGTTEPLAKLERNLPYPPGISASADGRTIFWTRLDAIGSDLLQADLSALKALPVR